MKTEILPRVDVAELIPYGRPLTDMTSHAGWQTERFGTLTDDVDPNVHAAFCISSAGDLKLLTFQVDGDDRGRLTARVIDESRPRMIRIRP